MRLVDLDDRRHTYIGDMGDYEVYSIDPESTVNIADIEPVRHGRWITKSTGGEYFDCCSECGYVEWDAPNNYCPNCGARMEDNHE